MSKFAEVAIVKKPHQIEEWTEQQLIEFQKCADPVNGPMYFVDTFVYAQHPTRGKIKLVPFDFQRQVLYIMHNYNNAIILQSRQSGKSLMSSAYMIWYAMFVPDSTVLIAAHKFSGAQEIMQRVRFIYENCPDHIRAGVTSYNKGSIHFDNGSRIVSQATTVNTGRGMSISLLYLDEFGFVRPSIAAEFWTSITPTLSTGGKAIITSTPNSDEDQFSQIWKGANKTIDEYGNLTDIGINGFKAFKATWRDHPERDEQWAITERAKLGEAKFRREHDCEFIIEDETLVDSLHLANLSGIQPIEKQGQIRWYKKPNPDGIYLIGLDPSLGTGSDHAAIQVFEMPGMVQVAEWQHNKTPIQKQVKLMAEIVRTIYDIVEDESQIYYSVENNTLGEAALLAIADIGEENIPGLFLSEPSSGLKRRRKGYTTTPKSKISTCSQLKHLIEQNRMKIYSSNLVSELKSFVANAASFAAKSGETDDLVMATILVVRMMQQIKNHHPEFEDAVDDDDFVEPMPFMWSR